MNSIDAIKQTYLDSVDELCRKNRIRSPFAPMLGEGKRGTVTYYADLGVLGETECEAQYILERDIRGLYPQILRLVVKDLKSGLYGRDIYGDRILPSVESDLIELAKEKEGLE